MENTSDFVKTHKLQTILKFPIKTNLKSKYSYKQNRKKGLKRNYILNRSQMDNLSGHMWGTLIMRVKFLDSPLCRDELKKARNIVLVTKDGTMGLKVFIKSHLDFQSSMIVSDISFIDDQSCLKKFCDRNKKSF